MSLFQPSVLKKQVNNLDNSIIEKAYRRYSKYFLNLEIQKNIRKSKEEQFQEGFLNELFDKVLGYTLNPKPKFNLTTEFKNLKGAKKADGAILVDGKALAVIELKSTKVKDLETIRQQAFDYKSHHPTCVYVITSTFDRLRFYIDNSVDFEEFDLFNLDIERFKLMYLLLSKENLLNNIAKKIKDESLIEEQKITKNLYADYSLFKREIYRDIVKRNFNNPELKELNDKGIKRTLFQKTQKLLDRFLFIFFGEDRDLLPTNSISKIIKSWNSEANIEDKPLYELYKQYFHVLDIGRPKKGNREEIFAYNGGLFKPDSVLDSLTIDDELLRFHTLALSSYNFDTDVDVNILGHIFENSLNEIESINAEIDGVTFDKQTAKRKKDGVFYTPKYITKYIVDSTIGKLCNEKKEELKIIEDDFFPNRTKAVKERLNNSLNEYRDWLLKLTILDPACGSGAFLNQSLDFLIKEHQHIDKLNSRLLGGSIIFPDIENHILENNIFGVDINDESVDIAKLSLWLRTAQKGRKLTSLSDNIKCGNSLIDSKKVAGNKAFRWEKEFPNVFIEGGFDVVIGNPPYVARGIDELTKNELKTKYETAQYQLELYVAFIEKGVLITKKHGYLSFIVPNSWLKNMMMSSCRSFLLNNLDIKSIIPSLEKVFPDASVDTLIFSGIKQSITDNTEVLDFNNKELILKHNVNQSRFKNNNGYIFDVEISKNILPIINKMEVDVRLVGQLFDIIRGINPYDKYTGQSADVIKERAYHSNYKKDDTYVPELKGMHTSRYNYSWDHKHFISYGDWLAAPRKIKYFKGERIIFREILGKTLVSTLITEEFKIDRSLYIARLDNSSIDIKYVLGILNSKLMAFYFRYTNNEFDNLFPKIRVAEFKKLPIKRIDNISQTLLSENVSAILSTSKLYTKTSDKFTKYLLSQFSIEKLSKKLQKWYELEFSEFIKELNKAIKKSGGEKLTKSDGMDWMDVFETKKSEVQKLKTEIDKTDKEIDHMVYNLYGLTEDEIKIIEES